MIGNNCQDRALIHGRDEEILWMPKGPWSAFFEFIKSKITLGSPVFTSWALKSVYSSEIEEIRRTQFHWPRRKQISIYGGEHHMEKTSIQHLQGSKFYQKSEKSWRKIPQVPDENPSSVSFLFFSFGDGTRALHTLEKPLLLSQLSFFSFLFYYLFAGLETEPRDLSLLGKYSIT